MTAATILRELTRAKKQKDSILLALDLIDLGVSTYDYPQGIDEETAFRHLSQLDGLILHYMQSLTNPEQR